MFGMNFVGFHGLAKDTTDTVLSWGEEEVGQGTFIGLCAFLCCEGNGLLFDVGC